MTLWGWLLIGACSWALAIVLKIAVDFVIQRLFQVALRDWLAALLSGIWSSLCELGLCALAFWYWKAGLTDALVTATGAALTEFVILLPAILSAHFGKSRGKAKDKADWKAFFFERSLIIANHLAARALLWIGLFGSGGIAAGASAFGLFAMSEAVQAYGQAREWDWLNPRTQWSFFAFLALMIGTEVTLAIHWH